MFRIDFFRLKPICASFETTNYTDESFVKCVKFKFYLLIQEVKTLNKTTLKVQ